MRTSARRPPLDLTRIACISFGLAAGWVASHGQAQLPSRPEPSPLAPGDLKRPVFDTRTPVYDINDLQRKSAGTVVAEVDGRAVILGDVADAIKELPASVSALPFADLFPSILAQLIRQQALVIRAQQQALDEDPAVRRKVKAASDRVISNALLEQELSRLITEGVLLKRYETDFRGKPGPQEVHVRVIMTPGRQEATDIIDQLHKGADFAALAKRLSKDSTAIAGGDLGFLPLEGLTAEVGAVAFSMEPGQFTPYPVRSAGSWFVVRVEGRRSRAQDSFSLIREELRQAIFREHVPDVITAALGQVTVRDFDINGKETAQSASDGGR